jgi:hypothetical protein
MAPYVGVCFLQCVNETMGRLLSKLAQVVCNDFVNVVIGQRTRNDRLEL